MRPGSIRVAVWLGLAWGLACALGALAQDAKPLPDVAFLRALALETNKKTEVMRERYLCRVRTETQEIGAKGSIKKIDGDVREIFFVKGHQITQIVEKNNKPLNADDAKKQIDKVKKQIEEAQQGKANPNSISPAQVVRLVKLTNERRVLVAGRPTIVFDGAGDPASKANSIPERIVQVLKGTISIDEQTGQIQDTNVVGMRDVKVGGGLVANIHKGFLFHIVTAPRPDGVWLIQSADGSGDARVGLFYHPSLRFHQETQGCRLFDVQSDSVESLQEKH